MTLRHLQIFVEVAETGKMSEAANHLFISQSSISQAIGDMESYYSTVLFERLSKKLYITPAGEKLLQYAKQILLLYQNMEDFLNNGKTIKKLRIGATFTVGTYLMSPLIQQFNVINPSIDTEVVVEKTAALERMLLDGKLDVALVEGTINKTDLLSFPVINDELFLICSPSHPFYQKDSVRLEELKDQPFILRERGSKTRMIFEQYLLEKNIPIHEKWICNNSEAIKYAVTSGQGLGVLSEKAIQEECQKGRLKIIPIQNVHMTRKFSIVYHKSKYLYGALTDFINICENYTT